MNTFVLMSLGGGALRSARTPVRVALVAASLVLAAGAKPAPAQVVTPDGALETEALLVLDINPTNGVPDVFDHYPQYWRQGAAFFRLDGVRPNDVDGASSPGQSAGPDGFRDAGLSATAVPACDPCRDIQAGFGLPFISADRGSLNLGRLTVLYLADSTGTLADGDDSILYVGVDVFNGNPQTVGVVGPGKIEDVDFHAIDFVLAGGTTTLCENGVADYNGDGIPDVLGRPFDLDSDGDPAGLGRWSLLLPPGSCPAPPFLSDQGFEQYVLRLFVCPPEDFDARAQLGFVGLQVDEGSAQVRLIKSAALNVPGVQLSSFPADGSDAAALPVSDVEFVIRGVETLVDAQYPATPYSLNRLRIANGGVQALGDTNADASAEDIISASWFVPLPQIEVKKEVRRLGEYAWHTSTTAVPGSALEFRVTIDNAGNVPLAVTLADLLEGPIAPDVGSLQVALVRPGDPAQNGAVAFANAAVKNPPFNPDFFEHVGEPGFLGSLDGTSVCLGILNPVEICGATVQLGDTVTIQFRATVGMAGDFCTEPVPVDVRNAISTLGDPDFELPLPCPLTFDGNEVQDQADYVDTLRERWVNTPPADDNVVTVDVQCRGDLNCDGLINAFDIDPFVMALTDPSGYIHAYPGCDILRADCNGDNTLSPFDIDPFIVLLTSQ